MVKVAIWGSLRKVMDGKAEVEVAPGTFKQVLDQLAVDYPGLRPQIKRGVSLALDGKIYRDAWFTQIDEGSEVVLMPYMVGG